MRASEGSGRRRSVGVVGLATAVAALAGLAGPVVARGGGGGGGGAPALSTAGVVGFTGSSADPGAWVSGPDGSGLRRLTPAGETWFADDVSRGPAGTPVTVLAGTGGASNRAQLYAVRADGTGSPVLLYEATAPARVHTARFSLDGTRVAFLGNNGAAPVVHSIYVGDVVRDGSGEVIGIANVTSAYDTSSQLFRGLDFSRAGDRLYFSMSADLWSLELATGVASRVTATAEVEAFPRCSPTDDRVAYERWPSGSTGQDGVICTLNVPTGSVTTITTKKNGGLAAAYLSYPCWSPDSAFVLYHAHDANKSDLWQVRSDGSGKAVNGTSNGTAVPENFPAWGW